MPRTFFADSTFLIAMEDNRDQHAQVAMNTWAELQERKLVVDYGNLMTTDYVVTEAFQRIQDHVSLNAAIAFLGKIKKKCQYYKVTDAIVAQAIETKLRPFCNHKTGRPQIGLTDAISVVVMESRGVGWIITDDSGFDNVPNITRVWGRERCPG